MIGNDVVDFHLAKKQNNWQRPGFLQKIFTVYEQAQILSSESPEFLIWLFWSMKESAYKAHQRLQGLPPKFNPWQFECVVKELSQEKAIGEVNISNDQFLTYSYLKNNCVYTYCQEEKSQKLVHQISSAENLKNELLQKISEAIKIPKEDLNINKDQNRIPQLFHLENKLELAFSLSHHGNHAAFAFRA
jgi:phosphopantetheinyl transferase (holo-ACP synthase)